MSLVSILTGCGNERSENKSEQVSVNAVSNINIWLELDIELKSAVIEVD
jgi:hypothetical protein